MLKFVTTMHGKPISLEGKTNCDVQLVAASFEPKVPRIPRSFVQTIPQICQVPFGPAVYVYVALSIFYCLFSRTNSHIDRCHEAKSEKTVEV